MSDPCFVIAIDGPAGAGKSTVARQVADRLGLRYLDSGSLYRAVGLAALEAGIDVDDEKALADLVEKVDIEVSADGTRIRLAGRDVSGSIRSPAVSRAASRVSAWPCVRAALVTLQRGAASAPGIVMEGRDIGTVIFPTADLKIFLDADCKERARRRAAQLDEKMAEKELAQLRREISERDHRDRTRALAPLRPARDALIIDSTRLSVQAVVERISVEARARGIARGESCG